jgi:hypothetical protein
MLHLGSPALRRIASKSRQMLFRPIRCPTFGPLPRTNRYTWPADGSSCSFVNRLIAGAGTGRTRMSLSFLEDLRLSTLGNRAQSAPGEVDVAPGEVQHLADPQAAAVGQRDHG